jgi:adenylosuccinate lyase
MPGQDQTSPAAGYQSPYAWRYGSAAMRRIWSEIEKRRIWRQIWVALAEAQQSAGLTTPDQIADLKAHADQIDIARAHEIEAEIHHDLMAELRTYAEQCTVGGGIIHLGATSMDITDNAEVLRQRAALDIILDQLGRLLLIFARQIERRADTACMGWTHLQPAEPTTIGYRLAAYAQDLLADHEHLSHLRANLRGKGFKGAVGSAASYQQLLTGTGMTPGELEQAIMDKLGLDAFPIATQTYPRRQDWQLVSALAGLAGTLYRFAFDLRLLQSPVFGEWSEPFGEKQVGSSAMPFKRNPVRAENIDSIGRYLATLPRVAWDNAAHCLLERTLDDSANRRSVIPEAFLAADHLLTTTIRIVDDLRVDESAVARNMATYGVFAASERVLMEAVRAGGNRQDLHEQLREHSMAAWAAIRDGRDNPLIDLLCTDAAITAHLPEQHIRQLMNAADYVGTAPDRARALAAQIRRILG